MRKAPKVTVSPGFSHGQVVEYKTEYGNSFAKIESIQSEIVWPGGASPQSWVTYKVNGGSRVKEIDIVRLVEDPWQSTDDPKGKT